MTFASCSMDITPEGEISDKEALNTVKDYEAFTNGLYAAMRSVTSGDYVVLSDIQLDDFHAVIGNGNRRMDFYNGSFTPATGEIASFYSGFYSVIAQTNFLLDKGEQKLKDSSLTPGDSSVLNLSVGTAHFLRAYCYNSLVDKFCESYKNSQDIDAVGKGLSLQLNYEPTSDNSKFPGRSSLKATYMQILLDIDSACAQIERTEAYTGRVPASNSNYITSDVVKALKARVCLAMGNDEEALSLAKEVIETNRYELTDRAKFRDLWQKDEGSEVLWQVQADFTYHGSATGTAFMSNSQNSDYVPTYDCVYLFDTNDTRWAVWFNDNNAISNSGGEAVTTGFIKYPGNSELYASSGESNFVNKAKPFRSAELYLIASEAAYNLNDENSAKFYLAKLETKRINSSRASKINAMSGLDLLQEIKDERHRELIGEGFRLADLKRWKDGFTRSNVYDDDPNSANVIIANYVNLHYDADDHRLVWPIPQHEMDANPQLKGQQNPGY